MLMTPLTPPVDWKNPPRLALGLSLLLSLLFVFWHGADMERQRAMDAQYRQSLLAIEWELYETHAGRSGQIAVMEHLKEAHRTGDVSVLRRYIGTDDSFVADMTNTGGNYIAPDIYNAWKSARSGFDDERSKLAEEALGIDPERFRPITFLTYSLVQPDVIQFIGVLLLLLTAGFALEVALGSGAVLAGFLGGGLIGAMTYLLANGNNVLILTGGGAAAASLTGMALAHFRAGPVRWLGSVQFSAILLLLLWLTVFGAEILLTEERLPELAAQLAALLFGPLWYFAHQRWFAHDADGQDVAPEPETDLDDAYRHQLHEALEAIARMDFVGARKRLRELVKAYPHDLRALSQLYQVEKLEPQSDTFSAVARRLFQLANTDDGVHTALLAYREYDRLSENKRALDTETVLKLVMRFARVGEVKDGEKLMKLVLDRKASHALLPKAALAMAQACEQLQDNSRAERYRELATSSTGAK